MTYSIAIHQKGGILKNTPDFAALKRHFSGSLYWGGMGRYLQFQDEPGQPGEGMRASYMLYGKGSPLGRGFFLDIAEDFDRFEVTTPLPTTAHDLVDMFVFAEQLAKYLGVKEVSDKFGSYPRAAMPSLYPDVLQKNLDTLKSHAISRPGFSVSGVRFPVQVGNQVCARIAGVPLQGGEKFFSALLDEKQRVDWSYLLPDFYQEEATGDTMGRYSIEEECGVVIPKTPYVPYGPTPFGKAQVTGWMAALVSSRLGTLGALPYAVFLERLTDGEKSDLDDRHYLMRPLSLPRLQEILEEA